MDNQLYKYVDQRLSLNESKASSEEEKHTP
nr:MAG TPA: hypothetical protein [Caudoviricetes sp.]